MRSCFPLPEYWQIALVVCGLLFVQGSRSWSQSANLLEDTGFEDGPTRVLTLTEGPWIAEEEDTCFVVQGNAYSGSQFVQCYQSPGPLNEAQLIERFDANPNTNYTATCWFAGDPDLGLGDDAHMYIGIQNNPPCPPDVCDDDADGDIDHAVTVAAIPLAVQTTDWVPVTAHFNSGDATHMYLEFFSVLHGSQFWQVDDCSLTEETTATCDCHGTDVEWNPVASNVCGSRVCGTDYQLWECTQADYQPTSLPCGG
ncbi:MAG TPA: hypothetical protein VLQ80_06205 [Candidatus Saccharimonadia bacterium]|nr:hypothetical protein [Candidatus Saccharimonadia bacterium]